MKKNFNHNIFFHFSFWGILLLPHLGSAQSSMQNISPCFDEAIRVVSSTKSSVQLELTVDGFSQESVTIEGKVFHHISSAATHCNLDKGMPDVPSASASLSIPYGAECALRIISSEYEDIVLPIAPSKGDIMRSVHPDSVAYRFAEVYHRNEFYPSELAAIGKPYLIRDVRGCNVTINPFQYNPVTQTLRIHSRIVLELSFSGYDGRNVPTAKALHGRSFESVCRNLFINYDQMSDSSQCMESEDFLSSALSTSQQNAQSTQQAEKMLVIACDSFAHEMRNFVIHKNNLGLPTKMVTMSHIGTTVEDVADFIQTEYDEDNALMYVLLVGDYQQIPSYMIYDDDLESFVCSDPLYGIVSGDDSIPDLIIGRYCADTKDDVSTMVNRTIGYENMYEHEWFHNGLGIASSYAGGHHGESDYQHMRNIRNCLLAGHYNYVAESYDGTQGGSDNPGNPTASDIIDCVNGGLSVINYAGHGSETTWLTSQFSTNSVNSLRNAEALPFVFSVACLVGRFDCVNEDCLAERMLKATYNNGYSAAGAIAFYGSSGNQSWTPPMEAQDAFNELLILDDSQSFGALCYFSGIEMINVHGTSGMSNFLKWHIFGDPSLAVIPSNNIGQTAFINDEITGDSLYNKRFIDIHDASFETGSDTEIYHQSNVSVVGPVKVALGAKLHIR